MLGYFPTPYEDELLYSVFARYHRRVGNTSITATVEELFGVRRLTAIVDFPCQLNGLKSNLPLSWDMPFKELVYNNTLFPLYEPFWPEDRAKSVLKMMGSKPGSLLHRKTGTNSNLISIWKYLRFCPKCFSEDEHRYGEAYWHRIHQIPGLLVCPVHMEVILNSNAPIYGINPQHFQAASRENCVVYTSIYKFKASELDKLSELAQLAKTILDNKISTRNHDWYICAYKSILEERGYVSQKGYVDQNSLVADFIDYYTPELLNYIGVMPNLKNKHNWVSMMVRKSKDYPHPIEHLMFIKYLRNSIPEFFSKSYKYENTNVNAHIKGPYPCLNAAADHYMHLVVTDVDTRFSRNKNLIATYRCSCGFVYSRLVPNITVEDIYRYDTICAYGDLWEKKFKELVEDKELHLREIAKLLRIDLKTVRKQISKHNLKTKWLTKKVQVSSDRSLLSCTFNSEREITRDDYRKKWRLLLNSYKNSSKSKLKSIDNHTFYWLYKYDNEWLTINSPIIMNREIKFNKVNWEEKDKRVLKQVEEVISHLLNTGEKPIRITDYRIGKELGMTSSLRNHLDKMPMTKAFLRATCESVEDYRIRKIKLVAEKLENESVEVKAWRIKQLTGLGAVNSLTIESAIMNEVSKRSL